MAPGLEKRTVSIFQYAKQTEKTSIMNNKRGIPLICSLYDTNLPFMLLGEICQSLKQNKTSQTCLFQEKARGSTKKGVTNCHLGPKTHRLK